MKRAQAATPEQQQALRALAERRLSPEELDAYVNAPMSEEERRSIHELIDWFTRRYPTPAQRLAYVRRATRAWTRRT